MLRPLVRSLRPTQWTKNLFVLPPLVFAEAATSAPLVGRAAATFALFCGLSSAVYLLNDLHDRERDRLHPIKRHRPLAAGTLSPGVALATLLLLGLGSLLAAGALGPSVLTIAMVYVAINALYSWRLKRVVIIDVMVLASGYVLRLMAGAEATAIAVSHWLLLCTIFLALFLAFSKRRHELVLLREAAAHQREVLDRYSLAFLDQMINVVTASTLMGYALYASAEQTQERFGDSFLLTVPFALYGIFRYLYLTYQLQDERNPTETMLRDVPFLINIVLWGAAVSWIVYL
jgi:4-hydroxybenzoate polyprenyltransferase